MQIETFPTAEALAEAATSAVIHALDAELKASGSAALGVTGGRSPGLIYDALSVAPLDWAKVRITLSDERFVDTTSPDSNEGLVRQRLLQNRAVDAHFVGLRGSADTPERAAADATRALLGWPALDVLMLGMGEDGHVASLFPGSPALPEGLNPASEAVIAVPTDPNHAPAAPRLSLTIRPLTTARLVLILTSGAQKRQVLEEALAGASPQAHPVAAVLKSAPAVRLLWTA